jgi:calcineurin-like phosphoesterase family protein
MSRRWFTSDLHLGHVNITKFRPHPFGEWRDVDHHDEFIIGRWNERVAPDDEVIVLGDFLMGHKDVTGPLAVNRLNGHIALVPGNHDGPWRGNKPAYAARWAAAYESWGIRLLDHPDLTFTLGGQTVAASHFPYDVDDRHGERFIDYQPADAGLWLLHGHVHDTWKVRGRQINVGVDVWGLAPVAEDTLIDLIREESA